MNCATIACCSFAESGRTSASFCVISCRSEFSIDFKQREGLVLVFVQRVALRIAAEAHDRAQMLQRHQMLAPLGVDRLQQQLLFDVAHRVAAKGRQLFRHQLVAFGNQPLQHHALIDTLFAPPI